MTQEKDFTTASSPSSMDPEKQSSPMSQAKKTVSSKTKVQQIDAPFVNGLAESPLTTQTRTSDPENASSLSGKKPRKMPVPKLGKSKDRTGEALKRLGVKPEQLKGIPPLSAMIKEDTKELGGQKAVLKSIRFSPESPEISAFLEAYDGLPKGDKERLPWEAIAISSGINVQHLLGAIQFAVHKHGSNRSKLIIGMGHPLAVAARVKYAQMASGEKDRTALDIMIGAQPQKKGMTIIFGGAGQAKGSSGGEDDEDEDETQDAVFTADDDLDVLFPPSNAIQEKLVAIRQKLLE